MFGDGRQQPDVSCNAHLLLVWGCCCCCCCQWGWVHVVAAASRLYGVTLRQHKHFFFQWERGNHPKTHTPVVAVVVVYDVSGTGSAAAAGAVIPIIAHDDEFLELAGHGRLSVTLLVGRCRERCFVALAGAWFFFKIGTGRKGPLCCCPPAVVLEDFK